MSKSDSDSEMPGPVAQFWAEFLSETGRPADTPLCDSFHFDDNQRDWRAVHQPYFAWVCERLGREPSADMEVVCERFQVLFASR